MITSSHAHIAFQPSKVLKLFKTALHWLFIPPSQRGLGGFAARRQVHGFAGFGKKSLLTFVTLFIMLSSHATVIFERDSSSPQLRKLNNSEINSFKKDRSFRYRDTDAPEESGIWDHIVYFFYRIFGRAMSAHVGGTSVYSLLLYGLMIFGVIMIIFQFFRITPQSLLSRSSADISVESLAGDNIHEIDFDKLIQQSVAQDNHRLAVRFWYLKMLKVLSDAQLIHWQISKTNYDYYYELKQQALRNEFLVLTNTFENTWYGNHNLSTERYNEAVSSFQTFFTTLSHTR